MCTRLYKTRAAPQVWGSRAPAESPYRIAGDTEAASPLGGDSSVSRDLVTSTSQADSEGDFASTPLAVGAISEGDSGSSTVPVAVGTAVGALLLAALLAGLLLWRRNAHRRASAACAADDGVQKAVRSVLSFCSWKPVSRSPASRCGVCPLGRSLWFL